MTALACLVNTLQLSEQIVIVGQSFRELNGKTMQDSVKTKKKQRTDLQWALALILIISISAFVMDYFEYRLASGGLDFIRHGPHFADNKNQEEQALGDFEANQDMAVGGMERHSVLVFVALFSLWRLSHRDVGGLTDGKQ